MREEILRMENVFVYNLNRTILEDFRLYVFKGEIISLVGLSGQGKTALYNILSGESIIEKGRVIINNKIYKEKERIVKNKDILCLGNGSILVDNLSVAENVFVVGQREYQSFFINNKHIIYKTEKLLTKYLPHVKANTLIKELTIWEMKMVELCKAIIMKPKLIVIDEAVLTCSNEQGEELINLLIELKDMGVSIIYESNKVNKVTNISDRMFIIRDGNNVKVFYKDQYSDILINNYLVGYDMPINFQRQSSVQKSHLLSFKEVYSQEGLNNINISLNKGEIIGIFHSENILNQKILDILTGNIKITSGEIVYEDKIFYPKTIASAKKQGIGITPKGLSNEYIIEGMDIKKNLIIYFIQKFAKKGIFTDDDLVQYVLKDIENYLQKSEYDGIGKNKAYVEQLILLYREIICNNKIFVCVNPCERADIIMKKMIYSTLDKVAHEGSGIIIIDNNIIELQEICDTIYIINNNGNMNTYKIK